MIIQVYDLRPFFVYIKLKEREKKKKFYIKRSSTISDFISVSEESENTILASLSMNWTLRKNQCTEHNNEENF